MKKNLDNLLAKFIIPDNQQKRVKKMRAKELTQKAEVEVASDPVQVEKL